MNGHCKHAYSILKFTLGGAALISGFDKFFHYLSPWMEWLAPLASLFTSFNVTYLMYGLGVVEIIVGLLLLSKYTKTGAYLFGVWMLGLGAHAVYMSRYTFALNHIVIGLAAFALACLAKALCECKTERR